MKKPGSLLLPGLIICHDAADPDDVGRMVVNWGTVALYIRAAAA
jgi:hypothetical protein